MKFVYGSFFVPPVAIAAFNGATSVGGTYKIGIARILPGGVWDTTIASNPVISTGTGWESTLVKDPSLFYGNGKYNMLYAGTDSGFNFQIGLATATDYRGTWTKYGSNPVLAKGSLGQPDVGGTDFPVVYLDGTLLRVWYAGLPGSNDVNVGPICYAESTNYGQTFTKYGQVLGAGTAGSFNDLGMLPGAVYKSGSTYYLFLAGNHSYSGNNHFRSAYVTCTDPQNPSTYSAPTQLSNYTGTVTVGGHTWYSNLARAIIPVNSGFLCLIDLFHPEETTTIESCAQTTSTDLVSWGLPTNLAIPFDSWSSASAENPSLIVPPT